jgi:hypothetical protein
MTKMATLATVTMTLFAATAMATTTPFKVTLVDTAVPAQYSVYEINGSFASHNILVQGVKNGNNYINTFCLEPGDGFTSGTTYWATIDNLVMYPDNDATLGYNNSNTLTMPLTDTTKKIYAAYLGGALNAYTTTQANLNTLQQTFWAVQKDAAHSNWNYTANSTIVSLANNYAASNNSWQNVKVMNLWGSNAQGGADYTKDIQSQLVMTAPSVVPEPSTSVILLTGMITTLLGKRRRR